MNSRNSETQKPEEVENLIRQVIGAAINVHRELGPGFIESIYEQALRIEFERLQISYECQKAIPIIYRECKVGEHRLDLLVERRLIVENKAVSDLNPVFFTTVRSYMKAVGLQDGLFFNFASMPLTIKRVGVEMFDRYRNPSNQFHEIYS